jgi:hypothetical protein
MRERSSCASELAGMLCDRSHDIHKPSRFASISVSVHAWNVKLLERITVEPGKCGGRPCIRGMRIRVTDILG